MHRLMTEPRRNVARVLRPRSRPDGRAAGVGLVLAVVLGLLPVRIQAQAPEPPALGIIVSVNGNERRKHVSGKKITRIVVADPTRVAVVPITPDEVNITGVAPGPS